MSTDEPSILVRVAATLDGWPVDLEFTIAPARLPAALKKLAGLGYAPRLPAAAPGAAPQPARRPTVDPIYQPDGTPCCPAHRKPLAEGQHGLYCTAKAKDGEVADKKGYCGLKFAS